MNDKNQAMRSTNVNWRALIKDERKQRIELEKKQREDGEYIRHLEGRCSAFEREFEQKHLQFKKHEAVVVKLNEELKRKHLEIGIFEKENSRLKALISNKNQTIIEEGRRMDRLSKTSRKILDDLRTSQKKIKELNEHIQKLNRQHDIALKNAGMVVDEYFKNKFLEKKPATIEGQAQDSETNNSAARPDTNENPGQDSTTLPSTSQFKVKAKDEVKAILTQIQNNEFELDTSEGVEDEADEISDLDFEKQLQFLENINLEK